MPRPTPSGPLISLRLLLLSIRAASCSFSRIPQISFPNIRQVNPLGTRSLGIVVNSTLEWLVFQCAQPMVRILIVRFFISAYFPSVEERNSPQTQGVFCFPPIIPHRPKRPSQPPVLVLSRPQVHPHLPRGPPQGPGFHCPALSLSVPLFGGRSFLVHSWFILGFILLPCCGRLFLFRVCILSFDMRAGGILRQAQADAQAQPSVGSHTGACSTCSTLRKHLCLDSVSLSHTVVFDSRQFPCAG